MYPMNDFSLLEDLADQFSRVICCILFVVQSAILIYYLVVMTGSSLSLLWIMADIGVLALMIYAFVVTYLRKRTTSKQSNINRLLERRYPGELPFAFAVWIFYSVTLMARVITLYSTQATKFVANSDILSTSGFQIMLSISIGILYFLIRSVSLRGLEHQTKQMSERWLFVEECLHLLDAIDLLALAFRPSVQSSSTAVTSSGAVYPIVDSELKSGMSAAILAFSSVSILLTAVHLAVYTATKYDAQMTSSRARVISAVHALLAVFLANLPLLLLRCLAWKLSGVTISAFVFKNVLFIYIYIVHLLKVIVRPADNGTGTTYHQETLAQPSFPENSLAVSTASLGLDDK